MVGDDRCRSLVRDCDEGKVFHSICAVVGLARGPDHVLARSLSSGFTLALQLMHDDGYGRKACSFRSPLLWGAGQGSNFFIT